MWERIQSKLALFLSIYVVRKFVPLVLVGYGVGYQANSVPLHPISNADSWNIEKYILIIYIKSGLWEKQKGNNMKKYLLFNSWSYLKVSNLFKQKYFSQGQTSNSPYTQVASLSIQQVLPGLKIYFSSE